MAFTPLLEALAAGEPFRLFGDGSASRSFTFVADAVGGTIAAMERGAGGELYNIGGGEEATMTRGDRPRGGDRRARAPASSATRPRWGTCSARAPTSRRRRRSSAGVRRRRSPTVSAPSGTGSLVGSRRRERGSADRWRRPRRRARGRPPVGLVAHHGALVAARSAASCSARSSACSSRSGAATSTAPRRSIYLGQPFTPAGGGQLQSLQTNPKTVSEIVRSEAAIKAAANAAGMQPGAAARERHVDRRSSRRGRWRATSRRSSRSRCAAPTKVKAEKAANSFANTVVDAGRAVHRPEDGAARVADRERRAAARGHRARGSTTANEQQRAAQRRRRASRSPRSCSSRRTRTRP